MSFAIISSQLCAGFPCETKPAASLPCVSCSESFFLNRELKGLQMKRHLLNMKQEDFVTLLLWKWKDLKSLVLIPVSLVQQQYIIHEFLSSLQIMPTCLCSTLIFLNYSYNLSNPFRYIPHLLLFICKVQPLYSLQFVCQHGWKPSQDVYEFKWQQNDCHQICVFSVKAMVMYIISC